MPVLSPEVAANLSSLSEIDWNTWEPIQKATLLFIHQDDKVLLIRKKRGLGAGKINAAGGRLEEDETELEGAVREMQEELCIDVTDAQYIGEVDFQFLDGYCFHLIVFIGTAFTGTPQETDEAIPIWFEADNIPYDQMWDDDIFWVPKMLRRERFYGRFLFDGDRMLDQWMASPEKVEQYLVSPHRFEAQ